MARMLELKREPEVVFWVFIFPLLLALGLGIAFRNKPGDAVSVAIVSGAGIAGCASPARALAAARLFKMQVLDADDAHKGFRLGKFDLVDRTRRQGRTSPTATIPRVPKACWPRPK